jgi:hypothetical protein
MRCWPLLFVSLIALGGCAAERETKVIVKRVIVEKPISERIVYVDKCPDPQTLTDYCKKFRDDPDGCDREQRCQWVSEHTRGTGTKVAGYCRRLYCKPEATPAKGNS